MTPSEAYLAGLCERAFLRLWSYPNLFRDQGKAGTKGDGKELCDLLVVFGDEVIIFSDKHCSIQRNKPIATAWPRWYRAAILKSAAQVRGAERWLRQYPERVFLNTDCTEPFPIRLPANPRFHRILTCRGAAEASHAQFGGPGSLFITSGPLPDFADRPFFLGTTGSAGEFYHVFDEVALDAVLGTLDTAADFCAYLTRRERFLTKHRVLAAGEEELLGYYMWNLDEHEKHDFVLPTPSTDDDESEPSHVSVDQGFWLDWLNSRQRAAKIEADDVSYCWDRLIDKFAFHIVNGTQEHASAGGVTEHEPSVRWMARETRMRRRHLAGDLTEMMGTVRQGQWRKRIVMPMAPGDPFWVFLVFPRPPYISYEKYRDFRQRALLGHCLVVKHLHPEATDVVGIGVEPDEAEMTEDILHVDTREWTDELAAEARDLHEIAGFFKTATRTQQTDWEFPIDLNEPQQ